MDKRVVIILANHGWSLTSIAERFEKSIARICQIVGQHRRLEIKANEGELLCEVCENPIKKKQYVKIGEIKPLLVCNKCKKEIQRNP